MVRRVVEKIPQIEEAVGGHAAGDAGVQVKEARGLSTKFNGVAPDDLGGNVFVAVSPLVELAANVPAKITNRDAADLTDAIFR